VTRDEEADASRPEVTLSHELAHLVQPRVAPATSSDGATSSRPLLDCNPGLRCLSVGGVATASSTFAIDQEAA
jgi:hypothetical protein